MEPRGQMLWASNQQWRAEAKGQRASEPWLSLGTSWGWERASQGSTPFHRQAGPAEPKVREAQLGQGFWDAVIRAPYVAHTAPTSPLLGCTGPFRVTPEKEEQPGNTRRVS